MPLQRFGGVYRMKTFPTRTQKLWTRQNYFQILNQNAASMIGIHASLKVNRACLWYKLQAYEVI